jgi:hypothetical protein
MFRNIKKAFYPFRMFRWTGNSFTHLVFNRIRAHIVFFAKNAGAAGVGKKNVTAVPATCSPTRTAALRPRTFDFDLSVTHLCAT